MAFKVCIDPGFGGERIGAQIGGIEEKTINLLAADLLSAALEKSGFSTCRTREGDETLGNPERVRRANQSEADFYISLHCNRENRDFCGLQICYHNPLHKLMADRIFALCRKAYKKPANMDGVFFSDWQILRETTMPAFVIKMGFITHNQDVKLLAGKSYLPALMKYLAEALEQIAEEL